MPKKSKLSYEDKLSAVSSYKLGELSQKMLAIPYTCRMVTNLTEYKSHITWVRKFISLSTK